MIKIFIIDLNIPFGMGEQTFVNLMVKVFQCNSNQNDEQIQDLQTVVEEEVKSGLPEEYIEKIKVMKMGNSNRTCSVCFNSFQRGRYRI